jgi:hypothetical protein
MFGLAIHFKTQSIAFFINDNLFCSMYLHIASMLNVLAMCGVVAIRHFHLAEVTV